MSMFISEKLLYTEIKELNVVEDYLKCVFVKILHNGNLIIVGTVYRPPNSNVIDFNDAVTNILEKNRSSLLLYTPGKKGCYTPIEDNKTNVDRTFVFPLG